MLIQDSHTAHDTSQEMVESKFKVVPYEFNSSVSFPFNSNSAEKRQNLAHF